MSPRISLTASTIIDLPAPVSPVSIFRPLPKDTCRLSIIAKSFMLSYISIIKPYEVKGGPLPPLTSPHPTSTLLPSPHQSFPQDIEIAFAGASDKIHAGL